MTAWMVGAINPNLIQTIEGQPVFVYARSFANIAIGQRSGIADRRPEISKCHAYRIRLWRGHWYEKFWNLKCRYSGLAPDAVVLVPPVRGLKSHGGAPVPTYWGREEYRSTNVGYAEAGCCNLLHHLATIKKSGVSPVVCPNAFMTDTKAEVANVRELCESAGARVGGYPLIRSTVGMAPRILPVQCLTPVWKRQYSILLQLVFAISGMDRVGIAWGVYGADGVDFSAKAPAHPGSDPAVR